MTTFKRQKFYKPNDRDAPYQKQGGHGAAPSAPYSSAPAVRVQNLKRLQSVCGREELATKLGVSLGRLDLMLTGVNFSDEMAYHSEQSLGLTPGFLDRPGAVLTEAEKEQLLKPFIEEVPEERQVVNLARPAPVQVMPVAPAVAAEVAKLPGPTPDALQEAQPSKASSQPERPAASSESKTQPASQQTDTLSKETNMSADQQANPPETHEMALRKVRQANLAMLTEPKGVKSRMVLLTGLSPANLSHRLHGHKIFDAETGDFFCDKLGLPRGWFETPHTPADIPLEVAQRLNGSLPGLIPAPALTQPRSTSKTVVSKPAAVPLARTKAQKATKASEGPALSLSATALGLSLSEQAAAASAAPAQAPVVMPVAAVPVVTAKRTRVAAPVPQSSAREAQGGTAVLERPVVAQAPVVAQPVLAPVNQGTSAAAALPLASANAGPLAQACLAVLTVKIQSGRLTEEKAMELLGVFANL